MRGDIDMTETTSPAVEERLVFDDHELIHIRNGGYQWIDVQTFSFPAALDDRALIGLLIQHVRYRHSYANPTFTDAKIIHGPYWLEAITPDQFAPVPASAVEALITTWANYDAVVPEDQRAELDDRVYGPIRQSTSCYQLADLRATAEHDWGYVLGYTGFHEFALINRGAHRLTLMVASDD